MRRLLKALWRMTAPIRRPIQAKLDAFLAASLARALETQNPARVVADEVGLVLDAVIAEQFRLQDQVEDLKRTIAARGITSNVAAPPISEA